MMAFRLRLQRVKNQGNTRIRVSLKKLKDPNIADSFEQREKESLLHPSPLNIRTPKQML